MFFFSSDSSENFVGWVSACKINWSVRYRSCQRRVERIFLENAQSFCSKLILNDISSKVKNVAGQSRTVQDSAGRFYFGYYPNLQSLNV